MDFTKLLKQETCFVILPSEAKFYDDEVLAKSHEIGVSAMSASDELLFKNADNLFNGNAVMSVIRNCCSSINKPEELNYVDVESLMLAIKLASGVNTYDYNIECPNCEHKGAIEFNIETELERKQSLKDEYKHVISVNDTDLQITLSPMRYLDQVQLLTAMMQQKTLAQVGEHLHEEEAQKQILEELSTVLAKIRFDNVKYSVRSLSYKNESTTDKAQITEFVDGLSTKDIKTLEAIINTFGEAGVSKSIETGCVECNHAWTQPLSTFDPVAFFLSK